MLTPAAGESPAGTVQRWSLNPTARASALRSALFQAAGPCTFCLQPRRFKFFIRLRKLGQQSESTLPFHNPRTISTSVLRLSPDSCLTP